MDIKALTDKNQVELIKILRRDFTPLLWEKIPEAKNNSLIMLYGSAALGSTTAESDIDIMFWLPEKILKLERKKLGQLSQRVWEDFSVDLTIRYPLELINSKKIWGNDFLLYCLWQGVAIYDPNEILGNCKQTFGKYPPEVLRDKIISGGTQIMRWLVRLGKYSDAKDSLNAVSMRTKLIKMNLILLSLRHNRFFDSHKLLDGLEEFAHYRDLVVECVKLINQQECDQLIITLTQEIQRELVEAGLLPDKFYVTWQKWKDPLRYPLYVNWL